jgi:hypothetical protein
MLIETQQKVLVYARKYKSTIALYIIITIIIINSLC